MSSTLLKRVDMREGHSWSLDAISRLGWLLLKHCLDLGVQIGLSKLISNLPITLSCLYYLSRREVVLFPSQIAAIAIVTLQV